MSIANADGLQSEHRKLEAACPLRAEESGQLTYRRSLGTDEHPLQYAQERRFRIGVQMQVSSLISDGIDRVIGDRTLRGRCAAVSTWWSLSKRGERLKSDEASGAASSSVIEWIAD
jgi:hypothetical protein